MQARLAEFIKQHNLFKPDDLILLAASGGIDSMVLCELLLRSGYRFAIAHCNFGLRDIESDADESFLRAFADRNKLALHVNQCDTLAYAASHHLSIQESARDLRYAYFDELIADLGYTCVATAHHADDQMETMLLNLIRGTGLAGLHGILPKRGKIVRPLLFASKKEIIAYAGQYKVDFREDSTNKLDKYLRNRVRHEVVQPLRSIREDIVNAFTSTADSIRMSEEMLNYFLDRVREQVCEPPDDHGNFKIQISGLLNYPQPQEILYSILNSAGFSRAQCGDILESETGAVFHTVTHTVTVDRKNLIVNAGSRDEPEAVQVTGPGHYSFGRFTIEVETTDSADAMFGPDKQEIFADVEFPFTIRSWKEGDRIRPLGMKGSKLLSDVFVDAQIPLPDKPGIPVLIREGVVFWVGGIVQAEEFRLTRDSKKVLRLVLYSSASEGGN